MPEGAAPTKICTVCRQDCSARPRVKDMQGRYTCRACLDRASTQKPAAPAKAAAPRAAATPAPPPLPEDDGVPADFWNNVPSQANTTPCPNCAAPLSAESVICLSCGVNRHTGKGGKVKVAKAEKERSVRSFKLGVSPGLVATVLLVLFGGGFFLAIGSEGAALAYYGAAVLLGFIAWVTTVVTAFMDKRIGWGIVGILAFIPGVGLALLYYALCLSERPYVKMLMAVAFVVGILAAIALVAAGVDLSNLGAPS